MIGFELEAFVVELRGREKHPILVPNGLPKDECGYLVEFRGKPGNTALEAAGLLEAEIERVSGLRVPSMVIDLVFAPYLDLPKKLRTEAIRSHGKPPVPHERGSLYNKQYHDSRARAGLHIHFTTQERHVTCPKCSHEFKTGHECMTNMVQVIQRLDQLFAKEIKDAKRLPGLFETGKFHGGFEYRSLPSGIDYWRVAKLIDEHRLWG